MLHEGCPFLFPHHSKTYTIHTSYWLPVVLLHIHLLCMLIRSMQHQQKYPKQSKLLLYTNNRSKNHVDCQCIPFNSTIMYDVVILINVLYSLATSCIIESTTFTVCCKSCHAIICMQSITKSTIATNLSLSIVLHKIYWQLRHIRIKNKSNAQFDYLLYSYATYWHFGLIALPSIYCDAHVHWHSKMFLCFLC